MNRETLKALLELVNSTAWNVDYPDFCRRLGRTENFGKDPWCREKWEAFRKLSEGMAAFDVEALAKVLNIVS